MVRQMVNQLTSTIKKLEWVKSCNGQIDEDEGEIIFTVDFDEEHYMLEKIINGAIDFKNILYFSWQLQYNVKVIINGQEYSLTKEERKEYIEKLITK